MTLFLTFASLFAAAIPMLFFLFVIWKWDLYDRKPIWLMGGAFLWGALGAVLLAIVGQVILDPIVNSYFPEQSLALTVTFGAPITEEPAKALILILLIRSRKFGNICDGFVFGAAAGLGFGMTENAKYFMESAWATGEYAGGVAQWMQLVVTRTLFSAVMHAAATSMVGAAAGIGKFHSRIVRALFVGVGMGLAMAMHALWNGILVTDIRPGKDFLRLNEIFGMGGDIEPFLYSAFFFLIELAIVLLMFGLCMIWENRKLKQSLEYEAEKGSIPKEHVAYLASYFRRRELGWLEPQIPKDEYIRLATHLAQRGRQARSLEGQRKKWYGLDYRRLQHEIADVLQTAPEKGK